MDGVRGSKDDAALGSRGGATGIGTGIGAWRGSRIILEDCIIQMWIRIKKKQLIYCTKARLTLKNVLNVHLILTYQAEVKNAGSV